MKRRTRERSSPAPDALEADRKLAAVAYGLLPPINGYPEVFSVFAGEPVAIRAARKVAEQPDADRRRATITRIEIRNAATEAVVATLAVQTPILEELPADFQDGGAGYSSRISLDTAELPPALYECVLHDDAGNASQDILFNVKPRGFEGYDLVCVLPTFTWQAYNRIGGGCFYNSDPRHRQTVSTQRPISRKVDNSSTGALPFLALFAGAGVNFACVDSWDLHHGLSPAGAAPVMALLTHDEYWTDEMRAAIEGYLARRGVLLVLAGNVCWWRIRVRDNNLIVNKDPTTLRGHRWFERGTPEETTFVSSFRFGGYALERAKRKSKLAPVVAALGEDILRASTMMSATAPEHPLFTGVKLGPGGTFGGEVPIMYREIDGVPLAEDGTLDRKRYRADEVTPRILATGLSIGGSKLPRVRKIGVIVEADVRGGHVLHLGSFGWSRGLTQKNKTIERIVLNAYRHCLGLARPETAAKPERAPGVLAALTTRLRSWR